MNSIPCCLQSPQETRIQSNNENRIGRERIYKILDRIQFTTPSIDIERALYFTRSMKTTEGQHLTLRWAKAMKYIAENITVYITPDQLLAGRAGQLGRYGIIYPEIDGDFYREVMPSLRNRAKSPFKLAEGDLQLILDEIAPYWEGKTFHEHLNAALPDELRTVTYDDDQGLKSKFVVSETSSYRSALQWVPDFEKVIKRGYIDIQNEAKARLAALDTSDPSIMLEKKPFLESCIIVCDAIMIWAQRHADLARSLAEAETDAVRKAELLEIAEICAHVPAYPARNFREAVQSQWFAQVFIRLEQKTSAIVSNGRMDQYFYPLYAQDLAAGAITPAKAKEFLECMWVEMAQYLDLFINPTGNEFQEGYAHWEAVTIGGQTPEGEDATNDLSYLFLESKREFPLTYPDLAARIHTGTPEQFLAEIAITIKDGTGYPKLINDEEIVPLYSMKGAKRHEALDYAVSGCTEARLPNRETYTSGDAYINFPVAVEMTLFNGHTQHYGDELIGLETGDASQFNTWEEFYGAYKKQHLYLLDCAFKQQYVVDNLRPQHFSSPMLSTMHDLCMAECKDLQSRYIEGGLDMGFFEFLGYGTVIDSLAAIKKQVFEDKRFTLAEIIDAMKANYESYEPMQSILKNSPCYGNNDPYADALAKDLDYITQKAAEGFSESLGYNIAVRYVPITSHVPFGKIIGALPNGRKAGAPLSDGTSASHGADRSGPTKVLLSNFASKNKGMTNSLARLLNLKLSPKSVEGEAGTKKLIQLIRTWCDLKLWHLQFNIINQQTLEAARKNPEEYRNLIVRIAGYSAYFCDLSPDLQDDVISRTEHSTL